ncbi:hypothetical protein LAZ67_2005931 [Cordylochernes scorpioides]|uniref:Uncharacterized protein n=1 Tax=Cordylochernes scorpioides TaxID=51811 RepID=A0ABY6K4W3_9ARAC|nr:hypothetical protein LAZ67_2005931 [Cordylochernes scorpioides]
MKMINLVELPSKSIVELLNEGILKKYKPYLATIDTDRPLNWLIMATKIEKSLTGSGTPVEKGHLQTSNPALHPSPRPAGYYGNSQVQIPPFPCRICERLGLELQWHYHSVCPYRNPTVSRSFPPATPRVHRPTASRSFPSATPHPYQAAASSTFPPPTPHDYQPTVASASSPDSPSSMERSLEQRYAIKFCVRLGKKCNRNIPDAAKSLQGRLHFKITVWEVAQGVQGGPGGGRRLTPFRTPNNGQN